MLCIRTRFFPEKRGEGGTTQVSKSLHLPKGMENPPVNNKDPCKSISSRAKSLGRGDASVTNMKILEGDGSYPSVFVDVVIIGVALV